jgi:ATP-dependent RNA helicase DDX49/DBP8
MKLFKRSVLNTTSTPDSNSSDSKSVIPVNSSDNMRMSITATTLPPSVKRSHSDDDDSNDKTSTLSKIGQNGINALSRSTSLQQSSSSTAELSSDALNMLAMDRWHSLGLAPWLAQVCLEMGLREPTEIQRNCIPKILEGRPVIASAPTGSGKTAAFALPILHKLSEDPFGPFAVIVTPTR